MPIKNNAKKADRQKVTRTARNLLVKQAYKKALKLARKAIEAGEQSADLIKAAQKTLDKAAKAGVIKPNTASRYISRLNLFANKSKKTA